MAITRVRGNTQLQFSGSLDLNTNKIINLSDGLLASDAVNKGQLDAAITGLTWKDAVDVSTTANITLSGEQTIDGVLTSASRVLVKDQTVGSENGIYVSGSGAWTRATDMDSGTEAEGAAVFVQNGTANADSGWTQTVSPVTIGTTAMVWAQFTGAGSITAGAGLTKTGNTIDVVATDASLVINANDMQVQLDATAGTLQLGGAGLQVADATAGSILVGQGTGTDTAFKAVSGDATLSATGALTLVADVVRNADLIIGEELTVTNGSALPSALANTPIAGTVAVYLNGERQRVGVSNDYTISGSQITFNFNLENVGGDIDTVSVDYLV